MNKFKIGDKVTVKENFWKIKSGFYVDEMKKLAGRTLEVETVYYDGNVFTKQDNSNDVTDWAWDKNCIQPYNPTITWDTLKWKDVVIDVNGTERMVLGVLNDVVFISHDDSFYKASNSNHHKQELSDCGYTIKQATPPPVTIEIEGIKYNKAEVENALKDLKAQG